MHPTKLEFAERVCLNSCLTELERAFDQDASEQLGLLTALG